MNKENNLYEILQVAQSASATVIQGAYRALLKNARNHPDLGGTVEAAQAINEAYSILNNPEARRVYDQSLSEKIEAEPQPTQFLAICPSCRRRNLVRDESRVHLIKCKFCKSSLKPTTHSRMEKDDKRAFRVGLFLYDKSLYDRARWEFQAAVRLKPRISKYHYWLGRTNYQKRSMQSARGSFKSASFLDSSQFHYNFWLGQSCYALQDFPGAAEGFNKAAQQRPNHMPTLLRLGMSYFRLRNYDSAVVALEKAVKHGPGRIQPLTWLGLSYFALNNEKQALQVFIQAERLSPKSSMLKKYIGLCLPGNKG